MSRIYSIHTLKKPFVIKVDESEQQRMKKKKSDAGKTPCCRTFAPFLISSSRNLSWIYLILWLILSWTRLTSKHLKIRSGLSVYV